MWLRSLRSQDTKQEVVRYPAIRNERQEASNDRNAAVLVTILLLRQSFWCPSPNKPIDDVFLDMHEQSYQPTQLQAVYPSREPK